MSILMGFAGSKTHSHSPDSYGGGGGWCDDLDEVRCRVDGWLGHTSQADSFPLFVRLARRWPFPELAKKRQNKIKLLCRSLREGGENKKEKLVKQSNRR